jgi:hypothetical protein
MSGKPVMRGEPILIAIVFMGAALSASYLLAWAGEPSSAWVWRDVFGILP